MEATEDAFGVVRENLTLRNALILLGALVLKDIVFSIYSAYFGPWSRFPGERFSSSDWYKAYVEIWQGKAWTEHLKFIHQKYGPVVRIGPRELSFGTPEAYHKIYNSFNRWDKEPRLYDSLGSPLSSFGLKHHKDAKKRRDIILPMFSRRAVIDTQYVAQENMDKFCEAVKRQYNAGKPTDLFSAWRCYALETVYRFIFNRNIDAIDSSDFQHPIVNALNSALPSFVVTFHFPLIRKIIFGMPAWLALKMSPATAGVIELQMMLRNQLKEVLANPEKLKVMGHPTLFQRLLDPEITKGELISFQSLYDESQSLSLAGNDTTGTTLLMGTHYILRNKHVYEKLKGELRTAWPDLSKPPRYEELEKLPYLTGVIKESLRMGRGTLTPFLRITPEQPVTIAGATIPPRTTVGVAGLFVHDSPKAFKDPMTFNPDRWLEGDTRLEHNLVAFARGPRSCIGINFAYVELYTAYANFFRRFDVEMDMSRSQKTLQWKEVFVPYFETSPLVAWCKPVES